MALNTPLAETQIRQVAKKGRTKRRLEAQESLRDLLRSQGHLQHVILLVEELESDKELTPDQIDRKKFGVNTRLRLLNKYLPDLKAIEHSSEDGTGMTNIQINVRYD